MRKILFKIIISCFFLFSAAFAYAYQIDISADNLEYDQLEGKITADGHVVLGWEGKKVSANYVELYVEKKNMTAYGDVKIEEGGNVIFADSVKYNYDQETGTIKETLGYSSAVFMRAESMDRLDKNTYAVNNIKISNCDLDDPHTYFKAKKGKIIFGDRVTLYNPIFYIGKIPVFYLPIITKSLRGGNSITSDLIFSVEPGYTGDGGLSLKTMVGYPFTQNFVAKGMFDYLGTRGNGYGTELNYSSKDAKATLYAYYINDLSAATSRWTVTPSYFQKIGNEWTIQSQAQFVSDESFNNLYDQNNWNRVTNTLTSYFSVTRQGKTSNLLVTLNRTDTYDATTGQFQTTAMTLPGVTYTYYPKKIFLDITNDFNFTYNNTYGSFGLPDEYFYKNTAAFTYNLSKNFKFGRHFTLTPSAGVTENWQDRDDFNNTVNNFVTRYFGGVNSRLRVNRWMDWNISYTARVRSEGNSLGIDSTQADYGVETNQFSFTNYMYVGDRTTVRNFVSYNFMKNRFYSVPEWSPFVTEITYTPTYYITAYIRQSQSITPCKFQDLQLDTRIGDPEKAYLNFGAFYQDYRSGEIDNTFGFGLWLTPKWRFDYNIATTAKTDGSYIRMNDHEFKLYRDLHCYNLGLIWRIRGIYHEVYLNFNLKTNMPFSRTPAGQNMQQSQQMFYPWR